MPANSYLLLWRTLSGINVDKICFITDHLTYNWKKRRICEVDAMVDANIGWIEYEFEVLV